MLQVNLYLKYLKEKSYKKLFSNFENIPIHCCDYFADKKKGEKKFCHKKATLLY